MYGENGSVLIELKRGFNPEVAGLKLTPTGGHNFNQRKYDEPLIRENTLQSTQVKYRTISGVILSNRNEPIPGVTIIEIGKNDNGTISDLNGEFSLIVKEKDVVYIDLSGMHFKRYLKYESGEDSKSIVFKHKGSKKADRLSEKVYQEWERTMLNKQ